MRRHGRLERVEERTLWGQLMGDNKAERKERDAVHEERMREMDRNPIEEGIRRAREERKRAAEELKRRQPEGDG